MTKIKKQMVWVIVHTHKYGSSVFVCGTQKALDKQLEIIIAESRQDFDIDPEISFDECLGSLFELTNEQVEVTEQEVL